jgi:hypothetical protein
MGMREGLVHSWRMSSGYVSLVRLDWDVYNTVLGVKDIAMFQHMTRV